MWYALLVVAAIGIGLLHAVVDLVVGAFPGPEPRLLAPPDVKTVAQIVPAVVVAIFVFAVGTQFVVAQVVPPARGTRAVEFLRDRHLEWTLSPALALTPLSAFALILNDRFAWPLAAALMVGAVLYLIVSTGCLLNILREATDPNAFSALLARRHGAAIQQLSTLTTESDEAPIDALYKVVRTLRGWTRTSATAGDSRELLVALEGTLQLIVDYRAAGLPANGLSDVPTNYKENTEHWKTSLLRTELRARREVPDGLSSWAYWVPPPYPATTQQPKYDAGEEYEASVRLKRDRERLPKIWVAHEVGRSFVRAVEFATTSKTLLRRDRARLLLALEKAARRFAEQPVLAEDSNRGRQVTRDAAELGSAGTAGPCDPDSAGVIVAHLVELGLGARGCESADVDWHFEPLARLAILHRHFHDPTEHDYNEDLAVGTAAAVLKVTEAITMARVSEHYVRLRGHGWTGRVDYKGPVVSTIIGKTVEDLRGISEVGQQFSLFDANDAQAEQLASAVKLAKSTVLEPRDWDSIHPTESKMLELIRAALQRTEVRDQRASRDR